MRHSKLPTGKKLFDKQNDSGIKDIHKGVSKIPPSYGIDFADHEHSTINRASEQTIQAKKNTSKSHTDSGNLSKENNSFSENNTGMPDALKIGLESMSGIDLSAVRVHRNSDKPAQLGASAYTQGQDIHLGPGQETHLPHEGWHVVQQKQGRVKPTSDLQGTMVNDDSDLEREADMMGARSVSYASVFEHRSANSKTVSSNVTGSVMQMKRVPTHMGIFEDETYTDNGSDSVDMVLKFEPGNKIDAKKIGLVQSVKNQNAGATFAIDPAKEARIVKAGSASGYGMDRLTNANTPVYGSDDLGVGKGLEDTKQDNNSTTNPTKVVADDSKRNATYQLGYHYTDGSLKEKDAKLLDRPKGFSSANSRLEFETTALALEGAQKGTYYGSVKWGYKVDSGGTFNKINFDLVSMGIPSQNFMEPAKLWNPAKTRGTMVIKANNTPVMDDTLTEKYKAAKDDEYTYKSSAKAGGKVYCKIEKIGDTTKNGYVELGHIKDKGDGDDMVDLPIPKALVTTKVVKLTSDVDGKIDVATLPKDTQVLNTFCHKSGMYKVTVETGAHAGKKGYVPGTDVGYRK